MKIEEPKTKEEFREYYDFLFHQAYEGWNRPKGSEKDPLDSRSRHIMAVNSSGKICAVGQYYVDPFHEAEIRKVVAKHDAEERADILVIQTLEKMLREEGVVSVIADVREPQVPIFEQLGYKEIDQAEVLWGMLPQYRMVKSLIPDTDPHS
jgi:hypothetical protein